MPLAAGNLGRAAAWSANALWMDSSSGATLVYRQLETNVSTNFYAANLDWHSGQRGVVVQAGLEQRQLRGERAGEQRASD